jgi:hypothetical protein
MSTTPKKHSAIPLALSVAMVLIVVAAGLVPNTGVVAAQSNCQYASCSTPANSTTPVTWYVALGVLALIAVVLGIILLMRRRPGGGSGSKPVEEWSGAEVGGSAAAVAGAGPTPTEIEAPSAPSAPPSVPPGAGAAYIEGPEDVAASPVLPAVAVGAGAGAAAGGEADIDSLMQELDKISGEILKRGTPKKDGASGGSTSGADDAPQN